MKESKIAKWLCRSLAGSKTCLPVQKTEAKEIGNRILDCHVTPYNATNGHAHYLREILINFLPTQ